MTVVEESEEEHEERGEKPPREIELGTNIRHRMRLTRTLHVRIPVDPRSASSWDDTFTLRGEGEGGSSEQIKKVRDDQVPGDGFVDLVYTELKRGWVYSLEIDPGDDEPYFLFKNREFTDLFG